MNDTALAIACVCTLGLVVVVIILCAAEARYQRRRRARLEMELLDRLIDIETLRDAVRTAHEVFEHYANLHDRKGTPEGRDKAAKNRRLASVMAIGLQITGPEASR